MFSDCDSLAPGMAIGITVDGQEGAADEVLIIEPECLQNWLVSLPMQFEQRDLFADIGARTMKVEEDDTSSSHESISAARLI